MTGPQPILRPASSLSGRVAPEGGAESVASQVCMSCWPGPSLEPSGTPSSPGGGHPQEGLRGLLRWRQGVAGTPHGPAFPDPFSLTLKLWDVHMLDGECKLTTMAHTILKVHRSK